MNLPFKETFPNGEPTDFIAKIWKSLLMQDSGWFLPLLTFAHDYYAKFGKLWFTNPKFEEKPHSIRKGKRWKAGMKIHFCIGLRTKNYFRFAPIIPVVSVQDIEIMYTGADVAVYIDKQLFYKKYKKQSGATITINPQNLQKLAVNDGFNSIEHFFEWFNADFSGQIIHWTKLKYEGIPADTKIFDDGTRQ